MTVIIVYLYYDYTILCGVPGNEHDAFAVWMFSFGQLGQHEVHQEDDSVLHGGYCSRTQYWSRLLTHMHFSSLPNGVPGNEDYGAMATWLLFTSLGLYPQAGTMNYIIGSPRIISATVFLDGHGEWNPLSKHALHIVTYNNTNDNVYVETLYVNGVLHNSPFIDRGVLTQAGGCTLEYHMTSNSSSGLCNRQRGE